MSNLGTPVHPKYSIYVLPSGKLTACYWKWPWKLWIFPLNMLIFQSYVKLQGGMIFAIKLWDTRIYGIFHGQSDGSRHWSWARPIVKHTQMKVCELQFMGQSVLLEMEGISCNYCSSTVSYGPCSIGKSSTFISHGNHHSSDVATWYHYHWSTHIYM